MPRNGQRWSGNTLTVRSSALCLRRCNSNIIPDVGWLMHTKLHMLIHGTSTVVFISRAPLVVADILLMCITWMKLRDRGIPSLQDIRRPKRASLSQILVWDGMSPFSTLTPSTSLTPRLARRCCIFHVCPTLGISQQTLTGF